MNKMFKLIVLAVLFIGVNSRYILVEDVPGYLEEPYGVEFYEHPRVRRGAETAVTLNSDGSTQLVGKVPFAKSDTNQLSAIGAISPNSKTVGLALDNIKGHGLTLTHTTVPFGEQLSAGGKLNVLDIPNHNLDAKAFVTRTMPNIPQVPNFNTVGGGLDYMYKNKIGAGFDVARTNFLDRTDVNAMGKLNLFKTPSSSFDFSAGAGRSFSPHIPNSSWEPKFDFTWSKAW